MLNKLFRKKSVLTGRVIEAWQHNGWGNAVEWSDYKSLRVVGWLRNKPVVNDEIRFKMLSATKGEVITRYIVTDVSYAGDPHDMFFATVKPFAYLGEPITDLTVKEPTNGA